MIGNDHDHDIDYADKYHRHYEDEGIARGLREDLGAAEARIARLEDDLRDALNRLHVLEDQHAPEAEPPLLTSLDSEDWNGSDEPDSSCAVCGNPVGIFRDRAGWHHYKGFGTAEHPVEIYDPGHEATVSANAPAAAFRWLP